MDNQTCDSSVGCDDDEPTRIYFDTPEDMLNPSAVNPAFMPIVLTHAIVFLIGIAGNTVVIVTWAGSKPSRTQTCTFLVSLAVADLLLLVIYVPLETLRYFVITWDSGGAICKLSSYVEMLSGMASVLNLTAVSIERFLVIAYPILARRYCTVSTCRYGLVVVWGLALALALPVFFTKKVFAFTYYNNRTSVTAYYCFDSDDGSALSVALYQLVALFVVPACFMTLCYVCVIRELWTSTRTVAAMTRPTESDMDREELGSSRHCLIRFACGGRHQRAPPNRMLSIHRQGLEIQQARKQVIKMLILVIALFLLCWGPRLIMHAMIKYGLSSFTEWEYNARVAVYLLSFAHSAINPMVYGLMSTNFRKMVLQCCKEGGCGKARDRPSRAKAPPPGDSCEFSTLTTSTRRSRMVPVSVNVDDQKMKKSEEQWTAV